MLLLARLVSLGMKSSAPAAKASRVAVAPSWVRLLTIPKPWLYAGILLFAVVGFGLRERAGIHLAARTWPDVDVRAVVERFPVVGHLEDSIARGTVRTGSIASSATLARIWKWLRGWARR